MPASDDDWRLTNQENYLTGRTWVWRQWSAPRPEWDHDHCEFCWVKFGSVADEGVLAAGWVTADDGYRWVCATCFGDFRQRFGWLVQPGEGPG